MPFAMLPPVVQAGLSVNRAEAGRAAGIVRFGARMRLPLLTVLACGVVLRVATMVIYQPSVLQWIDGIRYTRIYPTGFFDDYWMPAGYPAFLAVLHWLDKSLIFTIAAQHLVGLAGAVIAYLAVRRLGGAQLLACVPAAAIAFSGDSLYLEHIVMADFLLTFMSLLAIFLPIMAVGSAKRLPWLAAAGVVTACAGLVRSPGLALVAPVVVWIAIVGPGRLVARGKAILAYVGPFVVVIVAYTVLATQVGQYSGLSDMTGWDLYPRVAPFADCTKFQPPPGTGVLCQTSTPPSQRPGPYYYVWDAQSVSRRNFPDTPKGSKKLEAFAITAIVHEPLAYLEAIGTDLVREVDSNYMSRSWGGEASEQLSFAFQQPALEQALARQYAEKYTDTQPHIRRGIGKLRAYDNLVRVPGWMLPVLLALTIIGAAVGWGRMRLGALLVGMSSIVLFVVPVATLTWDYRYGIPPSFLLVLAGALGFGALWSRVRRILAAAPDDRSLSSNRQRVAEVSAPRGR